MHRPFVTTVKFENENGGVMRLEYAVADTSDAKKPNLNVLTAFHRRNRQRQGAIMKRKMRDLDAAGACQLKSPNDSRHDRLRSVLAILIGMTALAISVEAVTIMIHDRIG
jgi:hypothetical protein